MSQPWISVRIRKLPNTQRWVVHKLYPKQIGIKCQGWTATSGPTIEETVDEALKGLRNQLILRAKARLPK